jgi:hypothetical protein
MPAPCLASRAPLPPGALVCPNCRAPQATYSARRRRRSLRLIGAIVTGALSLLLLGTGGYALAQGMSYSGASTVLVREAAGAAGALFLGLGAILAGFTAYLARR